MPRIIRPRKTPTEDWQQLQLLFSDTKQAEYEAIRPIVLFGLSAAERARQINRNERTLRRKAAQFEQNGMASLFVTEPSSSSEGERKVQTATAALPSPSNNSLSSQIQQFIVDLKAQHNAFRPNEIANICYIKFKKQPDGRTINRILKSGLSPSTTVRRFPPYAQISDSSERRLTIVRLHAEGWNAKTIAAYLGTSRVTVHTTLKRWLLEGIAGLEDKPHARKDGVRKADLKTINQVRELQSNPGLGKVRVQVALRQLGIELSAASCARIMERNRQLYGYSKPIAKKSSPKPMPFAAQHRHQYWSVDVRYIEQHQLGGGHLYVISILENYSRAILCSAISRHQDLQTYLTVLYGAVRLHGVPDMLVSDSGTIFLANQAKQIYQALGIEKKEIARRQAWQNLIEAQWNVQRRMADYHFAQAKTWEEIQAVHSQWVLDFNYQDHWAHRERTDHRHSPAAVLGWVRGRSCEQLDLDHIFHALRYNRKLNRNGYIRFRHWQLYGEMGLARQKAAVWLYKQTLTVEFNTQPLSEYEAEYNFEKAQPQLQAIKPLQLYPTAYKSPQLSLWGAGEVEWQMVIRRPNYAPRRTISELAHQPVLFSLEKRGS